MSATPRRKPAARRQQIIDAAKELFAEHGFANTSLDAILARTGGSRRDIYGFFNDKQGLFDAVMQDLIATVLARSEVPAPAEFGPDVRAEMEAMGRAFLQNMLDPVFVSTMRQFISVATDRPDLGKAAYQAGPAALYARIRTYLDARVATNDLAIADTAAAARIFVEMLKGEYQVRALMTGDIGAASEDLAAHVRTVVDIFLHGVQRQDSGGAAAGAWG